MLKYVGGHFLKLLLVIAMISIAMFFIYSVSNGSNDDKVTFAVMTGFVCFPIAIYIYTAPESFSYFFTRIFTIILFMLSFTGVVYALLIPEVFMADGPTVGDGKEVIERRIFLAVSSAGMMGGMMKYFASYNVTIKDQMKLWSVIHASIIGLFVSLVLFMVLRAGIVNQNQVDTFNIWGVTGVSAITGFFAKRVMERFSSLYDEVIGKDK